MEKATNPQFRRLKLQHSVGAISTMVRQSSRYSPEHLCLPTSAVQLLSHVWFFVTPWAAAGQTSLSITNSWSLLKFLSIESVMPSNLLILCRPLLLLPSIFSSIRIFSSESVIRIRWPKYWCFSFSISPSNEYSGLISLRIDCLVSLQSKGLSRVFSNKTVRKYQLVNPQLSSPSNSQIHTWLLEKP